MGDAYKSQKVSGNVVNPAELLACATIDGQEMLFPHLGSTGFSAGAPANFQIVDWQSSQLMKRKSDAGMSAQDLIFALMWLWQPAMTSNVFMDGKSAIARSH